MGLITVSVKVEEEVWNKIPHGTRSYLIRKFCKDYVNQQSGNLEDVNIELLKVQIVQLRNGLAKHSTELQSKESMLNKIIEGEEEKRREKLEHEKETIESQKKCFKCGSIIEEGHKFKEFKKGKIHYTCYMSALPGEILEWIK